MSIWYDQFCIIQKIIGVEQVNDRLKIWVLAARPKTLAAGVSPVLVASGLAIRDGVFRWQTQRMIQCGDLMGIELLDHFIIGHDDYVSLRETTKLSH